eukprot:5954952-Pyramimonas_sp.AAC.1
MLAFQNNSGSEAEGALPKSNGMCPQAFQRLKDACETVASENAALEDTKPPSPSLTAGLMERALPIFIAAHNFSKTGFFKPFKWRGYHVPSFTTWVIIVSGVITGVGTNQHLSDSAVDTLDVLELSILW